MPEEQNRKIDPIMRRAAFDPKTINEADRTVDVVFATENPVRMWNWSIGEFEEVLSMDSTNIRMDRIKAGLPVLDNHYRWGGASGQLGIAENVRFEGKEGRATLRFSKREEVQKIFQDIQDGIVRGISVGYRVHKYVDLNPNRKEGEMAQYRATDWEPMEISLAPIMADPKSTVRNENVQQNEVEIITTRNQNQSNKSMADEKDQKDTQERKDNPPAPPTPPAPPVNVDEIRQAATAAERGRVSAINEAVRKAGLEQSFADELISGGKTIEEARAAIIDKWSENDPHKGQRNNLNVGADENDKRRSAMESALILRANPSFKLTNDELSAARDFRGMSLIRMAEEVIVAKGGKTRGLSAREIATAALGIDDQSVRAAGLHTTSDFPIILGNTINRVLRAEYALAAPSFKPWTRQTTATDFRTMTKTQFGEVGNFEEVFEGGEYKATTIGEAKESYAIKKYGQMITVSWETLVNDDLGAFSRIPSKIASAAARKQSDIVYTILSSNPAMGDSVALFHSTHGNLAASGGAIDINSLGAARKSLRNMKGVDKKDFLNLTASFLVVGPNSEQAALQYTSSAYVPDSPTTINPWKNLQVIVEPRITGNEWYLMVSPNQVDTIEYAYLEGDGELYTETKQGFEVDGVQVKARMTFGAKAIDFRGMYKNAGA